MKRIKLTMSQALVKFLDNQYVSVDGVENKFVNGMFGVFGHGCVVGIGQALEQGGHNLRFYQGKNEQHMALAATAFAKQKDRREIIPCVSSIGPGAMNMVTAAGCATANRIPLLLLPGDTFACRQPDPVLQQAEFFDSISTTVTDAFRAVTHYWDRISRPEQLLTAALNAMRVLTDPVDTGAVCLAMPQDVEGESYDYPEEFFRKRVWYMDRRQINDDQAERAAAWIRKSEKPIVICGGGVRYSDAGKELQQFCEQFNIPFGETQAGKGTINWQHPLNLGGIGVTGTKAANVVAQDADCVIAVGTRLSDFTTSSKWLFKDDAKFVSINVGMFDAIKMDAEPITCDAREGLKGISKALAGYKSKHSTEKLAEIKTDWLKIADELYEKPGEGGLSQCHVLGEINKFMGETDIAICAAGSMPGDFQRLWRPGVPGTYHVEYGFSNMCYECNGAIGVKLAAPDQEVWTFIGDGGYIMGHSEIVTAVQENLKIHFVVVDNSGWGCIENLQVDNGSDTYGTTFRKRDPKNDSLETGAELPVDFAMNAESYGVKGYRISTIEELRAALEDAKTVDGPVLYDIKVLPGSMSPGFESWWRVGVASVSNSARVQEAYEDSLEHLKTTRDY